MTRVLCLTSWFPPHHFGGYELSCHDVMGRLTERGHHVEVLTSDFRHDGVADPARPPVAAVHRHLQLYFRDGALWSPSAIRRFLVERHNQQALRRALDSCRPDVVAVWHVGAMSLGLVTALAREGIPLVYAVSDDWPAYVRRLDPWFRAMVRRPRLARLVESVTGVPTADPDLDESGAFCFISEVTRQRCRRSSPWEFPLSTIVYSGFDGRLFAGDTEDGRRAGESFEDRGRGGPRLLYVGRIDARKGIKTLVDALRFLPSATLTVDGRAGADEHATLDRWTQDAGVADRVEVQCSDRSSLPAVYRAADVCVFPSEWEEPFGLVPLEAMACGTPVVASGVGGSGEFLVDGGNCVLFEPGDPESLAGAIRRVERDPSLRRGLVENGHISARHFDADHLADAFEAWHTAAAGGFSGPLPPDRQPPTLTAGRTAG